VIETTPGRCIFNDMLPKGMPFYNLTMAQKKLSGVISDCFTYAGSAETIDLLDRIKELGFPVRDAGGDELRLTDLKIPAKKADDHDGPKSASPRCSRTIRRRSDRRERYNQVIDAWTHARVEVTNEMMRPEEGHHGRRQAVSEPDLPDVGFRRSRQHRSDPAARRHACLDGQAQRRDHRNADQVELPRRLERAGVLQLDTRRPQGLADTALKTADSGYLTRKLASMWRRT
jgi:DNA-directed RNA polymerase subunit beta'